MFAGRNAAVATGVKLCAGFLKTKVITAWSVPRPHPILYV